MIISGKEDGLTFSLIARDPESGALGGIAATGNLCVGAWVLRGDPRGGLTASQGKTPSTLWGEDALDLLRHGLAPAEIVGEVTSADAGRAVRQLGVLSAGGDVAAFDGSENHPYTGHRHGDGWLASGNWLTSPAVLDRAAEAYLAGGDDFARRLLAALRAGVDAGSDSRGTLSAALLVIGLDRPPLSLRVDWDEAPVDRLSALHDRTNETDYNSWLDTLPTRTTPEAM